jgi:DNA-binding transcriptional ArsR family regulator
MKYMEKLLWWLITGKRGGINRARIIKTLHNRPYNAHQLAKELDLDYKTVRHHLKILKENKVIKSTGDSYSKLYFLTEEVEQNYDIFREIWEKITEKS